MIATIEAIGLTATHDGEAALVVTLRFPGGGRSQLQVPGEQAAEIMRRANVRVAGDLVGQPWHVLQIGPIGFTTP